MCFKENQEDRISIVQMNSELRHAELELLSAHCATHKLRLRFSTETVARHGRRDVLRKSIETASALSEYYSSIEKQMLDEDRIERPADPAGCRMCFVLPAGPAGTIPPFGRAAE
jgi:hypothetical protein